MKKKILASILAVETMAICAFSAVACNQDVPQEDEVSSSVVEEVKEEGELVAEDVTTTPGMRLNVQRLATQYTGTNENSGIATVAEDAYTLTATVLPADAADKTVTYTAAWQNANSTWASGKKVTDYVSVTQATAGALTATVTCQQAFGEPIVVTVTSNNNPDAKAIATLHYKQKILSYDIYSYYNEFVTHGLIDYTEYGTGTDELTGTFTPDYEYNSYESGPFVVGGGISKSTTYTRADDTTIGYMELVPTEEFKAVLTDMGVLENAMSIWAEGSSLEGEDFFDYRWFYYYGFDEVQTSDDINSHIAALTAYTGTAFNLNLYTAKGGTKLAGFNLTLNTSKISGQKQVESVTLNNVELEF